LGLTILFTNFGVSLKILSLGLAREARQPKKLKVFNDAKMRQKILC